MIRLMPIALIALLSSTFAQDPLTSLPDAYKVEFENDYVKVVRVHYEGGVKLPPHTHPDGTTAFVYLNDSEGVIFRHTGSMSHVTNRPPVKTGSLRITMGVEETHSVENTSAIASDFLRIVLKTEVVGARGGRRMSPTDMQFANGQMRITRLSVPAGEKLVIASTDTPALVVSVPKGLSGSAPTTEHLTRWLDRGRSAEYAGGTSAATELLRFDLLTSPAKMIPD